MAGSAGKFDELDNETLTLIMRAANCGPELLRTINVYEQALNRELQKVNRRLEYANLLGRTMLLVYCCSRTLNVIHNGIRSMHWYDWIWMYFIWSVFISWQKIANAKQGKS